MTRNVVSAPAGSSSRRKAKISSSVRCWPSSSEAASVLIRSLAGWARRSGAPDWLFARIPVRYPNIKIVLSEGGIGWVPMMLDRLEYISRNHAVWDGFGDLTPAEVLRRNFWFTTFSDPRTLALRHEIGLNRIMVETDYPHSDSSWPDTQELLAVQLHGVPDDEANLITWRNAAELYRHPVETVGVAGLCAGGRPTL